MSESAPRPTRPPPHPLAATSSLVLFCLQAVTRCLPL